MVYTSQAQKSSIKVTRARPSDAPALVALARQLGYVVPPAWARRRAGLRRRGQALFVARSSGRVVGWAEGRLPSPLLIEGKAELTAMVVDSKARGCGVGAKLLDAVEAWARRGGAEAIRVRSKIERQRAHRFYERQGYRRTKVQVVLDKPL